MLLRLHKFILLKFSICECVYAEIKMSKTYALGGGCSHVLFINDLHFISQLTYSSPIYEKWRHFSSINSHEIVKQHEGAAFSTCFYRISEFHIFGTRPQYIGRYYRQYHAGGVSNILYLST